MRNQLYDAWGCLSITIDSAETYDLQEVARLEADGYSVVRTYKECLGHGPSGVFWLPEPKTVYILERTRRNKP